MKKVTVNGTTVKMTKKEFERAQREAMMNLAAITKMTDEEVQNILGITKNEAVANLNQIIFA